MNTRPTRDLENAQNPQRGAQDPRKPSPLRVRASVKAGLCPHGENCDKSYCHW